MDVCEVRVQTEFHLYIRLMTWHSMNGFGINVQATKDTRPGKILARPHIWTLLVGDFDVFGIES